MPTLSFRIKLLLAMMLVVAVGSTATLLITERKVQAAYERLFKEQLEAQITYLPKEQEARLSAVKEKAREIAESKEVLTALKEGDVDQLHLHAREQFRKTLGGELDPGPQGPPAFARPPGAPTPPAATDSLPRPGALSRSNPSVPKGPVKLDDKKRRELMFKMASAPSRPRELAFVVFLGADGQALEPSSARWKPFLNSEDRKRFQEQLIRSLGAVRNFDAQQVGYFGLETEKSKKRLLEVVLTPIIEPESRASLGVLAIAFPFQDQGEQAISAVSDIVNGIWLDDTLHSRTIPEPVRRELSRLLPDEIKAHYVSRSDFLITITNAPYRVFYTPLNPNSALPVAYKVGLYSWEGAIRAQQDLRNDVLGFGSLTLMGALVLSLLIANSFSIPIRQLVAGTAEIQKNNFAVRVPVRGRDEIAQLAESFNRMTEGLALKERYHNLLNLMADRDVADQLLKGAVALGGEVREVSVLFCDIRGFSALTQSMSPQEIIQLLNEHMTALTRVVYEHGGVVDKYVGDMIMALFGAPKSYGDDAWNAANCALRMLEEREKLNRTAAHRIAIGVSIATGSVVAGCMGSSDRMNYTVLGERVNLAARLCHQAEPMEVLIDQNTYEKLPGRVKAEPLPELKLKGLAENVHAYRLLSANARPALAG